MVGTPEGARGERVSGMGNSCIGDRGPPEKCCGLWDLGDAPFPLSKAAHISDGLPRTMAVDYMSYTNPGEGGPSPLIACPLHQLRKTAP